jgi:PAS domain S-box-containing protein
MKANTALGMLGAGLALWLMVVDQQNKTTRIVATLLATFVTVLGILNSVEYLWSVDFHIDQLLFSDPGGPNTPTPGRMSPITAGLFVVNGLALLLFGKVSRWLLSLSLVSLTTATLALVGYALDVGALYSFDPYTSVAIHTALSFVLLSLGILAAGPTLGLERVIVSDSVGGGIARVLGASLPIALFVLAALSFAGEKAGYYEAHFALALLVMSSIVVATALTLWMATKLRNVDIQRQQALDRTLMLDEELHTSAVALAAIVNSSDDAILSKTLDGTIATWNPGAEGIYGYAAHEIIGRPIATLAPYGCEEEMSTIMKRIQRGERVTHYETKRRCKNGEIIDVSVTISPIASRDGVITGASTIARDITEHKRAIHALQESEALNRAVLNSLPANIAVVDGDGRIRAVNEGWKRFARENGDPPAFSVDCGADYLEVCRQSAAGGCVDAREALIGLEDVLRGSRSFFEMQYPCHSENRKRWFRMIASPLTGAAGGAVITHVDYTGLKQAEERFRRAVEAAPSGMVMVDSSGKIVLVNSRTEELFGYAREDLLGQSIEILVPESFRESHVGLRNEFFIRPLARPMGAGRNLHARRKDGTQFPVEIALNPVETEEGSLVLSSVIDVTERMHAEEERQKFVSLADRSLDFVGMCDLEFRPFYVNAAGMRLVGLDDLKAACQVKVPDFYFPEDQPFITNDFLPRVLREGHGEAEIRFRHFKTGEAIWMLVNVFSIFDACGATVGWATVSVNLTERKRAEIALQESRQELRALAGRLLLAQEEERKRIARELHDDLSQKVALLAFETSNLVLATPTLPDETKKSLCNLQTRIAELGADVRHISHRLHPSILEDLGLVAALSELCEDFSARTEIRVVFEQTEIPGDLPVEVAACLYRLAQEALHNVQKHAQASQVQLSVSGSPEKIRLCIQDDGIGFTAGSSRRSLGIVSMKERVRLVEGEFSIHSQPGQGTTITVSVPLLGRQK